MRKRLRKAAFFAMSVMMVIGATSCSSDDDDNGDDSSNGGIGGGTGLPGQGTASWTISGNENENISAASAVVTLDTDNNDGKYQLEIMLSTATIDNPMNSYSVNMSLVHETNPFDSLQTNIDYELHSIDQEGVIIALLATPNAGYGVIESGTLRFQELSTDKVEGTFEFEAVWNDETAEVTDGSFETNFIQIEPQ